MTDHAYVQHPVWTTRDQCEYVSPDQETNAICGMPKSAHAAAPPDLRALLREAREALDTEGCCDDPAPDSLCARIDAALASGAGETEG